MFGLPGETIEDHKKAVKFYHGLKYLNRIKCHNLVVYPQSEIKKVLSIRDN
jgi:coproporphyrinogen III oxidase-like Fe-S oxidoreductase